MRTTIDLPDALFRQAKARAALQGRSLKDLVAEGLSLLLQSPAKARSDTPAGQARFPLIKATDPARRVTPEMVAAAEEHLLNEEAGDHGRLAGR